MPFFRALAIGPLNTPAWIRVVAMPVAPEATALLIAFAIWFALLEAEPVHV